MTGYSRVILGVVLLFIGTKLGRSQTVAESRGLHFQQECPSGTPYSASEGEVCRETSKCHVDETTRHCSCDDKCILYGDCCINAPDPETIPTPSKDFQYEECQPRDNKYNGLYMISRCPETFQDDDIRTLCETDPDPDPTNMFLSTPVTDVENGRLFRNYYCAMCHRTALESLYFWALNIQCFHTKDSNQNTYAPSSKIETTTNADAQDTDIDDGTSVSEDEEQVIDDGTSVPEDDEQVIDDGTSDSEDDEQVIDDGTSVSEDDNQVIDDGTSVSEDDNQVIDDGTSVSEDENQVIDDGTSASEDEEQVIDDGTSVSEDDDQVIDDGTSASEDDDQVIDDGTSVSEDDEQVIDDGTSDSEDDEQVIDDGTSDSEDDEQVIDDGASDSEDDEQVIDDGTSIFEDNRGIQPSPIEGVLALLRDPTCKFKFNYRGQNSFKFRSCRVVDVKHYVNDEGQNVPCPPYLDPYFASGFVYKNRKCASCNKVDMSSPICHATGDATSATVRSFANLFLLQEGYGTSSYEINPSTCTKNEVFDPYSVRCRKFSTFKEPTSLTTNENPQQYIEVSGEFYLQNASCVSDQSKLNDCEEIDNILQESFESLITSFLPNNDFRLENISTFCYPHKDLPLCNKESSDTSRPICTFRGLLNSELIGVLTELQPHQIGELLNENYRDHGCDSELTLDIQNIFIAPLGTGCDGLASNNQSSGLSFTWKGELNMTDVTFVEKKCPGEMNCTWSPTIFQSSEYVFDGSDVILKTSKQHLSMDLYKKLGDGLIAACVNLEEGGSDKKIRKRQEKVQIILTGIGGSMSVVCLGATVLTYLVFPKLRNNVGKGILSLVLSLLVAQICQLALWDKTENEYFCAFAAILSHYTFLAAFFWMNVLSFDLSRTFGSRSKMQTVRDSSKVFFFYSIYGWCTPLLIIGVCMVIDFGKFEKLNAENESVPMLQYGNHQICWILDQVALTYAFGVPIAVLLLCNAVFFADTIYGIFSARAATKRATHTNQQLLRRDGKKDFFLFCKLSCIMGITWLFGFVSVFTGMQVFQVIFIILNSTQGVFIFISFGCNKRVIEMWRTKYTGQRLTSTKSNSYTATAKTSVNSLSGKQVNQIRIKRQQDQFSPV